jgi:hypothetical protein
MMGKALLRGHVKAVAPTAVRRGYTQADGQAGRDHAGGRESKEGLSWVSTLGRQDLPESRSISQGGTGRLTARMI